MAQVTETVLSVPDVSCEHCVKTVNDAVGALPGIQLVNTDIPTKSVQIRFDADQVSIQQIEEVLDEAGYPVAE
jgi:copper chaperone